MALWPFLTWSHNSNSFRILESVSLFAPWLKSVRNKEQLMKILNGLLFFLSFFLHKLFFSRIIKLQILLLKKAGCGTWKNQRNLQNFWKSNYFLANLTSLCRLWLEGYKSQQKWSCCYKCWKRLRARQRMPLLFLRIRW